MLWFILAASAAFLWAFVNILDKVVVTDYTKSPLVAMATSAIVQLLIITPLALLFGFQMLPLDLLAVYAGIVLLWVIGVLIYYKSMEECEVSRVVTILNTIPLFVLVLAFLFLGESITLQEIIGIVLLVLGSILVSIKTGKHLSFNKWLLAAPAASLIFAMDWIVSKWLLETVDWWSLVVLRTFIYIIIMIILSPFYYKRLLKIAKRKRLWAYKLASESFYLPGRAMLVIALGLAPAALVSGIGAIQPFFVLLLAVISTKFVPQFLKEDMRIDHLAMKIIAVLLAVVGAFLIS